MTPHFIFFGVGGPIKNTLYVWFYVPKERKVTLIVVTGCRAFNYGQEPNIRCFVAKAGLSRVTRAMRGGGSQKVTNDDEGEGGGHNTPQN